MNNKAKNILIVLLLITNACGAAIANDNSDRVEKGIIRAVSIDVQYDYLHEVIWELKAIIDVNTDINTDDCLEFPNTVESCEGLYKYNDKVLAEKVKDEVNTKVIL